MVALSLSSLFIGLVQSLPPATMTSNLKEYVSNIFVVLIWIFFLYSLITLGRYLLKLQAQYEALDLARKNYLQVEKSDETHPEIIKEDLLKDVDENSIVAQRVKELYRISIHGGDFDQVALAEVLAAREGAKTSIARYVASVLVLLGLCGAIWGLSHLVFQMGPALNQVQEQMDTVPLHAQSGEGDLRETTSPIQESFRTLIKTMSTSLANTRSAFAASLTGILASVLLLLANWWVARKQVDFLTALEDLTATRLIPIFKPPREASELAGALESFKEGSNFLVRLSADLDSKVSQVGASLEDLFAVVRKFSDSSEALRGNQTLVYEAQSRMMEVVDQFMGLTTRIEAQQAESKNMLNSVVAAVGESNQNISRAIEEWQDKHESLLQVIQQNSQEAHFETTEARETAQQGITAIADLIRSSLDNQVGALSSQALEMLEQQQIGNRTHLQEILEQQSQFVNHLQEAVINSDGHREMLDGMAKTIEQERNTFSERLEKMLSHNEDAIKVLINEQKKLLDVSGLKKVEEQMAGFAQRNQEEFSALMGKQDTFASQFGDLGKQAGRLGTMLRLLIGVATVSIPVFAALGIMFIFDLRPIDPVMRIVALLSIMTMIFMIAWFLRSKT